LWFVGQLISLIGTWMQSTAQGFLVFQLTHSSAYLGYIGFAVGIPSWLLMLYGGVIADRISRRSLLIMTQIAMMIPAFLLAALAFTGLVQPWHIIVLALWFGVANAFDAPTRQSFVIEMVDRESLTNAIALNSMLFNSATTLGPAAAGIIYAAVGPGWCFAINGLSFVAVILALVLMRLPSHLPLIPSKNSLWADLQEGFRFVIGHATIRLIISGLGIFTLFGMGMMVLMPAWSVNVLHGHARTNGLLFSARGLGSLFGALIAASLGNMGYRGQLLTSGSLAAPILLSLFAVSRWLPLSLITFVGVGLATMLVFNMMNALVQLQLPDHLRGRVMGIYTLTFFGLLPIGSLLSGVAAEHWGEPATVLLSALILFVIGFCAKVFFPQLSRLS
jgi:MFS family permease